MWWKSDGTLDFSLLLFLLDASRCTYLIFPSNFWLDRWIPLRTVQLLSVFLNRISESPWTRIDRTLMFRTWINQRSMFWTSTFCRSTALYINKNLLKYRTKCHLKMLCKSTALYINHCWSKNHISFILFHRSIIICLLCCSSENTPQRSLFKNISLLNLAYIIIIYQLLKVVFTLSFMFWH